MSEMEQRRLEFVKDFVPMLEKLYTDRIGRLRQCDLDISFEKLLKLYGVKGK